MGKEKEIMKVDPIKPYESLNKVPLMVWEYRSSMMRKLKEEFMKQLHIAQQTERKACEASGQTPMMQGTLYKEVSGLVERCATLFHIEALARFIFTDNEIPSWSQVVKRAELLKNALGVNLKN